MMCVVLPANTVANTIMTSEAGGVTSATASRPAQETSNILRNHRKEPNNNDNNRNNRDHEQQQQQRALQDSDSNRSAVASNAASTDDFGSTDEVKVFNDEDERDGDVNESYQAELQAEKSSLIHESEQVNGIHFFRADGFLNNDMFSRLQSKSSTSGSSGIDKDLIFRHEDLAGSAAALAAGKLHSLTRNFKIIWMSLKSSRHGC